MGNLGEGLAARLNSPFFSLAKSVGVEGAFQRVEGVVTALWTFADLSMGGVLIFAIRAIAAELLPEKAMPWVPWGAVLLGLVGALACLSDGTAQVWNRKLAPMGNLVLGFLLPGVLWTGERIIRGGRKNGISCMKEPDEIKDIEGEKSLAKKMKKIEKNA